MSDILDHGENVEPVVTAETDREVTRLWRAWKTVHEMCYDRGYELTKEEVDISLEDFKKTYTNNGLPNRARMTFQAAPSAAMIERYKPLPNFPKILQEHQCRVGTIYVEFSSAAKIGIKQMREFAQTVQKNEFSTGVLVYPDALTAAALKIIPAVLPIIIETFSEPDLLVNITKHELVPKHILLSAEEKKALLERYRLKENQLPRIQATDPVARYLGLRRGQVVKIIRKSETAGRYASYRWTI